MLKADRMTFFFKSSDPCMINITIKLIYTSLQKAGRSKKTWVFIVYQGKSWFSERMKSGNTYSPIPWFFKITPLRWDNLILLSESSGSTGFP